MRTKEARDEEEWPDDKRSKSPMEETCSLQAKELSGM